MTPVNCYRPQLNDDELVTSLGMFEKRSEVDKYGSPVSLIYVRKHDQTYRMVHHSEPPSASNPIQFATIYGGRGKYIKVRTFNKGIPGSMHTISVGPYSMGWAGDDHKTPGWYECKNPSAPDLSKQLLRIDGGNEEYFIMRVLELAGKSEIWTFKAAQKV